MEFETFIYEMLKKYDDRDIAVVCKKIHNNQLQRLREHCPVYIHTNQNIICKVAIINYDVSIIDFINKEAKIYQVIHGDYSHESYKWKSPTHERITKYIGITQYITNTIEQKNKMLSYNPLTIDKDKPIILVSATRLSAIKGKGRMIKLAQRLDNEGIDYIWYVFTNDTKEIKSSNVIYMSPRLDVWKWIARADYLVQLSDTEACSYSINEALYRNVPVIVTPLPYLEEIGVKHKVNSLILNFDCSNIDEIVKEITNIPKFNFKHLEDEYKSLLVEGKNKYKEERKMKVKVRALETFKNVKDSDVHRPREVGEEWEVDKARADVLLGDNAKGIAYVELVEEVKEEVKEEKKKEPKKKTTKKGK